MYAVLTNCLLFFVKKKKKVAQDEKEAAVRKKRHLSILTEVCDLGNGGKNHKSLVIPQLFRQQ